MLHFDLILPDALVIIMAAVVSFLQAWPPTSMSRCSGHLLALRLLAGTSVLWSCLPCWLAATTPPTSPWLPRTLRCGLRTDAQANQTPFHNSIAPLLEIVLLLQVVMGALATTLALGVLFLGDQYLEYSTAPFTLTDGPYGTTFFLTTGFHGMHVFLGACWLAVAMKMYPRYNNPGVGMRGGILYWHFVDIVWIAVYGIIYVAQL